MNNPLPKGRTLPPTGIDAPIENIPTGLTTARPPRPQQTLVDGGPGTAPTGVVAVGLPHSVPHVGVSGIPPCPPLNS